MRDAVFCHLVVPTVNILMLLECLWEVSEALLARGLDRLKSIEGGLVKFKSLFGDLNFRRQASKLKSGRGCPASFWVPFGFWGARNV